MGSKFRILPDPLGEGWLLELHGTEQSHVNLEEPWEIRHEYARRISHVLDRAWPALEPITVLHLGAGALTLPRYVAVTRPGSEQTAVDIEPGLCSAVISQLPLPYGARIGCIEGDAREQLANQRRRGRSFHAIVLDVFAGKEASPAHLANADFYLECLAALRHNGLLIINVGDDEGSTFLRSQVRELERAWGQAPLVVCDARVWRERAAGNAVLVAGPPVAKNADELISSLRMLGPHPAFASFTHISNP